VPTSFDRALGRLHGWIGLTIATAIVAGHPLPKSVSLAPQWSVCPFTPLSPTEADKCNQRSIPTGAAGWPGAAATRCACVDETPRALDVGRPGAHGRCGVRVRCAIRYLHFFAPSSVGPGAGWRRPRRFPTTFPRPAGCPAPCVKGASTDGTKGAASSWHIVPSLSQINDQATTHGMGGAVGAAGARAAHGNSWARGVRRLYEFCCFRPQRSSTSTSTRR
jgi:hypothetical protein